MWLDERVAEVLVNNNEHLILPSKAGVECDGGEGRRLSKCWTIWRSSYMMLEGIVSWWKFPFMK